MCANNNGFYLFHNYCLKFYFYFQIICVAFKKWADTHKTSSETYFREPICYRLQITYILECLDVNK